MGNGSCDKSSLIRSVKWKPCSNVLQRACGELAILLAWGKHPFPEGKRNTQRWHLRSAVQITRPSTTEAIQNEERLPSAQQNTATANT
jgi:hypothetical protein